ncbi:MAG: hypothetical protein IPG68_02785 [Micrococcales bacterium]|nr:hypothetical protein [Micrococcales bacterium]
MITHKSASRSTGFAALYLAAALVAAMIYFLVGTDYPSVTDPVAKVDLLLKNQFGIYVMYLIAYVGFGLALSVLALGLQTKLAATSHAAARVGAAIGLIWAGMLIASGVVYIVGMASVVDLHATDPAAAVTAWQAIEPVALGLGGAGGEVLGGTWVLLVSLVALRGHQLPTWLTWLGLVVGAAGIVSTVPGLAGVAVGFGLLVIVWFAGLGMTLLRERSGTSPQAHSASLVGAAN